MRVGGCVAIVALAMLLLVAFAVCTLQRERQPDAPMMHSPQRLRRSNIESMNTTTPRPLRVVPTPRPLRVVLCLFGVLPRSIRVTWPIVQQRVLNVLRARRCVVTVAVFNLDVNQSKVDGVHVDKRDADVVPCQHCETQSQAHVDREVERQWCHPRTCRFMYGKLSSATTRNALRQMYLEDRVGIFLASRGAHFDAAVVSCADNFLVYDVRLADVALASRTFDAVFTTTNNDAGGYTNGYYIGAPGPLAAVMRRIKEYESYPAMSTSYDYEYVLRKAFEANRIRRLVTAQVFFKVRASRMVVWQGAHNLDWQGTDRAVDPSSAWFLASMWRLGDRCRVIAEYARLIWLLRWQFPLVGYDSLAGFDRADPGASEVFAVARGQVHV